MKQYYVIIPLILIVISCGKKLEKPNDKENINNSKTYQISTIDKLKLIIEKAMPNFDYTNESLTCESSYDKELEEWKFTYDWHKPDAYFTVFIKNESAQYFEYQISYMDFRIKYYLTDPVGIRIKK